MFTLAHLTGLELMRDRILHGLLVIFILISLFGLVLGQLSFAEQLRITMDFSTAVMHLSAVALVILVGAQNVQKDIDRKTIYTVLARPVKRHEYLLGKALGLVWILALTLLFCTLSMFSALFLIGGLGISLFKALLMAAFGIFLEASMLLAIVFFLSQFLKPPVTVFCGLGFFLVGHWIETLKGFAQKDSESFSASVYQILIWFVPNLEKWNWKQLVFYDSWPTFGVFASNITEACLWMAFYFALSLFLFSRRELVS